MSQEKFQHGQNCQIQDGCRLGFIYRQDCAEFKFGDNSIIRAGTIIYGDVTAGTHFQTGHNAVIREHTHMGDHVLIGTGCVIDGHTQIGSYVKIETGCYIPTHVTIGNRVFFGPNVTLTNDKYPLRQRETYAPAGPVIEDDVTIGAGAVICPGVTISANSFIAAGAVVTRDVPPGSLVSGVPGVCTPLPDKLREPNRARSWPGDANTHKKSA